MPSIRATSRPRGLLAAVSGAAAIAGVAAVGVPTGTADPAVQAASADVSPATIPGDLVEQKLLRTAVEGRVTEAPAPAEKEQEPAAEVTAAAEPVEQAEPARSVWDDLADCESGEWTGDGGFVRGSATWDATAGLFEGGVQFHPGTWDGYKDPGMPAAAYDASRAQQIAVAERVLADQGWKAWPVCSRKLGLR